MDCYENLEIVEGQENIDSPYIEEVYYCLFYNRYIREKINHFKFSGKNYLYRPLGEIMLDRLKGLGLEKEIDLILYIPSHRRKEALRGYNQGQLLGKYIAKSLNIPLCGKNLVKTRWTKEQSGLNRLDRRLNLKDSFKIKDPKLLKGKYILLVDDIITTGATLEEASKKIIQAGGKRVVGLTLTSTKI